MKKLWLIILFFCIGFGGVFNFVNAKVLNVKNYTKMPSKNSGCCPPSQIKRDPKKPSIKIIRRYNFDNEDRIKESKPIKLTADQKKINYFESNSSDYVLECENNGSKREIIALPELKVYYKANSTLKNFFMLDYAKNKKGDFEKIAYRGFGFKIPHQVEFKLVSDDESDGFILLGDKAPDCKNIPEDGYTTKSISLEPKQQKSSYSYFYYKIGKHYGVGRIQNQYEVQQQGNLFAVKLRLLD